MREDGLRIDRLLLTTDTTFIPTTFGPAESGRYAAGSGVTTRLTRTIVYTYDHLYRLTNADYSTGEDYQYDYDEVGNRLQQIIDGDTTDYLYDAANRLESLNGQQVYSFDANGNLLNSDTLTNTWDAANRLINSINSTNPTNSLTPIYNGVNDRVGQTIGATTTHFALDVQALPEVIYTSPSTGSGQAGNAYLHLPGVIVAESSTGETRYLLSDGLGSVRQAVDETAQVVAYYEFDPYGNPVNNTGGEPYGYTGEWYEGYTHLLHLRARWYSSESGTFLSVDPVESEPPYQYVGGNPIRWIDPSGYCTPEPGETTCIEMIQTDDGFIRGTTTIIGETASENFLTDGGLIQETTFTVAMCSKPTETGLCYNLPSQQRPTLQPLNTALNFVGNTTLYPLSVAGATTKFVEQGAGLHGQIVYSWNLPPQVKITPRGTIRSYPSNLAHYSTIAAASIPIVIGVVNAGEIQLRSNAGEINSNQAGWQHGVNVVATTAGSVGGAWAVPAGGQGCYRCCSRCRWRY